MALWESWIHSVLLVWSGTAGELPNRRRHGEWESGDDRGFQISSDKSWYAPVGLLHRMPLLDRSPVIGRGGAAALGQVAECLPEDFPSASRSPVVILMVCGSYPEFYWIPYELDCFQTVPLLRIMLTSSASLLL